MAINQELKEVRALRRRKVGLEQELVKNPVQAVRDRLERELKSINTSIVGYDRRG